MYINIIVAEENRFMIQRKRLFQSFSAVNRESRLSDTALSRKSLTLLENSARCSLPPERMSDCFGVSQKGVFE